MSVITLTDTNPKVILGANPKRRKLRIQMQASNVDSGNTGRIHIGFGFQPIATVGHPSQGEVLIQGSGLDEPGNSPKLDEKYKRTIYAISSQNNQSLTVEEEVEE